MGTSGIETQEAGICSYLWSGLCFSPMGVFGQLLKTSKYVAFSLSMSSEKLHSFVLSQNISNK